MKKSAQAAIATLVLLLGGVFAFRPNIGNVIPVQTPTANASVAPPPAAPLVLSGGVPAGSLGLRWAALLGKMSVNPPASGAEEELARAQERDLSQELRKWLAKDPSQWLDMLEVLSEEDPRVGRKIVESLGDSVDDAAEGGLIRSLRTGRHRETRMSSATLIGGRSSTESLWALVTASQEDPDSGVRYKALSELVSRRGRDATPAEQATIDQLIHLRAQVDPDPEVRQFALRVTGQFSDYLPGPPPTRAPRGGLLRR